MNKKVAIVGITGAVGQTFVKVIEERKINAEYVLFASSRSAGKKFKIMNKEYTVIELNDENIRTSKCDFALFSAGGDISKRFAPIFAETGCIVIDNSSAFRMDDDKGLVVPEVNPHAARGSIIANPNCSTIPCMVVLKPLDDLYGLKRVVFSTYQAVSGAGTEGITDLREGQKGKPPQKFVHPIYNNLIPHIDSFLPNGNTKEEQKMINESRKILGKPDLAVSATTVRIPIENCHSISINVEFNKKPDIAKVRAVLLSAQGVVVLDQPEHNIYPMPINADDKDEVFVGRIRIDESQPNTLNMFVVCDNIRKGAATNAVQILQLLI